jgi:hypothetical protein
MLGKIQTAFLGSKPVESNQEPEQGVANPDPSYLSDSPDSETQWDSDGNIVQLNVETEAGSPTDNPALDALVARVESLDQRGRDKDRHIGLLEGQVKTLSGLVTQLPQVAGAQPVDKTEGNPPLLDADTQAMFEARFAENPADAVAALVEHVDTRAQNKIAKAREADQTVAANRQRFQDAQQNILSQLERAVVDFGEPAQLLVNEFKQSIEGNESAIGRMLIADNALATTRSGVYSGVGNLVLQLKAAKAQDELAQGDTGALNPPTGPSGVPMTGGVERQVGVPPVVERSPNDRIGDAIVSAGGKGPTDKLRAALLS